MESGAGRRRMMLAGTAAVGRRPQRRLLRGKAAYCYWRLVSEVSISVIGPAGHGQLEVGGETASETSGDLGCINKRIRG